MFAGSSAAGVIVAHKQARDGADGGDTNDGENDTADGAGGAAKQPAYKVEAEQANQTPVDAANDEQHHANFVNSLHNDPSFSGHSVPSKKWEYTKRA